MSNTVKKIKQTCTCENCGSEAEMIITCTLDEVHHHTTETAGVDGTENKDPKQRVKGSATCATCGNEADMWIDL